MIGQLPPTVVVGLGSGALALAITVYLLLAPRPVRLPADRRRPYAGESSGPLARGASVATSAIGRLMGVRASGLGSVLEQAGVKARFQDFVFLVVVACLVAGALGTLVGGLLLGVLFAVMIPIGARVVLSIKADRRRAAFADQLDDSLQLMASSLRAGHSMLQALDSVAREAEEPTSEEFARIINETRLGREVNAALEETAARMGSEDFVWVTQAVAINREVGGNLAEVLDGVGNTIRERNDIRRQVKTLAAEGKLSAYVLMALPFGITGFLSVANPTYIGKFTDSLVGYGLIVLAIVLLIVGGIWMRKVVQIRF
ncbi:type II secretion system F family protein [Georgenia daeguensis]|uniref:Type II secretion system F family protein n=1 Tax=Georgenia daeguensis TaxID=908355 RepID=A0ABP8EQX2_9MICO